MKLPEILDKIRRPLNYASKDDFANLGTVKGLHETIRGIVNDAMSVVQQNPRATESLRELRLLFLGFEECAVPEQRRRILEGVKLIDRMGEPGKGSVLASVASPPVDKSDLEAIPSNSHQRGSAKSKLEGGVAKEKQKNGERSSRPDSVKARGQKKGPEKKASPPRMARPPSNEKAEAKTPRKAPARKVPQKKELSQQKHRTPSRPELLMGSVTHIRGVGPKFSEALDRLGIETIEDLLFSLPRDYQDRREIRTIEDLVVEEECTTFGTIQKVGVIQYGNSKVFDMVVSDETGQLHGKWFHFIPAAMASRFSTGMRVVLAGKVEEFRGDKQIIHPEVDVLEEGEDVGSFARLNPVYPLTEGISQRQMRKIVLSAIADYGKDVAGIVPQSVLEERDWPTVSKALEEIHQPPNTVDLEVFRAGTSPAHQCVVFDEFFALQVGLSLRRANTKRKRGIAYPVQHANLARCRDMLPFVLTPAQDRALDQIKRDMIVAKPMNRLLQGDVGSGKTIVALLAAVIAMDHGRQVALMAPTEIVADQHYRTVLGLLDRLGKKVALLTGSVRPTERDALYPSVSKGRIDMVIGTHALLSEGLVFKRLGLVIIDEQHRFGVEQRADLKQKGARPDVLVMTATPIPRSLALTVFGDLDISTMDSRPADRKSVRTKVLRSSERDQAYELVREEVKSGRQAYVVYPTIESEITDVESAQQAFQRLSEEVFSERKVALLHGKMSKEEKEEVISKYRKGGIDILVSTTVVAVGVDVPNATVMIVEGADRFGLAELHQLRGRVGRGRWRGNCFLIPRDFAGLDSINRLALLAETADGFKVADTDLALRGFGDLAGVRQAGLPAFRVADFSRDTQLLIDAREVATALINKDASLKGAENRVLRQTLKHRWGDGLRITEV